MEKPKVGDILYSLNIGNAAIHREKKLVPVIVKKVGRKYFTAGPEGEKPWMDTQYYLEDWSEKTGYTANSRLYRTIKEYEDEKEGHGICKKLKEYFKYGQNRMGLQLSALKEIESIVDNQ